MEDQDLQARKEEYSRFHDWIGDTGHEIKHRQTTCDFLIKEECMSRHNQDNIRVSTNCCTRNTQGVECSNNISHTKI